MANQSDFNGACSSSTVRFSPAKTHGIADRLSEVCSVTKSPRLGYRNSECNLGINPNAYRYWKIDQVAVTGSTVIEVGEWGLVDSQGQFISGTTWYNGGLMYNESIGDRTTAAYSDGVLNSRAFQILIPNTLSNFATYDHGEPVQCRGFAYNSFFNPSTRYITGLRVQASSDNVTFVTVKELTGMTVDSSTALKVFFF